ncbi:MAG: hypothetical protein JWQ47_1262 [Glaciihabitans sp.]|nr:hypothetical protein [Glaciihabitans sp.]
MTDTTWLPSTFAEIDRAEELILVIGRAGGDIKRVPVWVVTVDADVYVRSYTGVTSLWFRRVQADPLQALRLAGGELPVVFENVDRRDKINKSISAAFTSKYAKFDYVSAMTDPAAVEATLRVRPSN